MVFRSACVAFCFLSVACVHTGSAVHTDGSARLADRSACQRIVREQIWGGLLHQIPATVIDTGVLRDIPYTSFRNGDYEMNVYGDPNDPCCVEAGVYRGLLKSEPAKRSCVEFMKAVLRRPEDREVFRELKLDKDIWHRQGLTFEITPETDEDAYGGWWVSVYNNAKLESSRAPRAVVEAVSEPKSKAPPVAAVESASPQPSTWTASELRESRPSSSGVSTGRVYVRGYVRKDGTYVRPHTRRR